MRRILEMSDSEIFYTYPRNPKTHKSDLSKAIESTYLLLNGSRIVDPNTEADQKINLYKTLNPDGTIDEKSKFQNTNNYFIVPVTYDPSEASAFAQSVNNDIVTYSIIDAASGLEAGLDDMINAYSPGRSQDLQRSRKWGVPDGEVAPAFKDAASWNLGYVTEQTEIPNVFAEIGGGVLNVWEYENDIPHHKVPVFPFGMDADDERDFKAGIKAAQPPAEHGLGKLYEDMLAIGRELHGSIAPIISRHSGLSRSVSQDKDTKGDDASVSSHFHQTQNIAASTTPHVLPDLFHQIGEQVLRNAGIGTVTDRPTPNTEFSVLHEKIQHFYELGQSVMSYFRHVDGDMAAHSPAGHVLGGALQHRPYMRDAELPSIAPIRLQADDAASYQNASKARHHRETHNQTAKREAEPRDTKTGPSQTQVKRALEALLNAQARMPPSGPTTFDPRLTPAWAGLKLPQ